jgi:hypothetical protein
MLTLLTLLLERQTMIMMMAGWVMTVMGGVGKAEAEA